MNKLLKYGLILALVALPLATLAQATTTTGVFQPPIGGSDTSGNSFVPLTNIPGVIEQGTATTLPFFLNGIYKLAIGIGATIAVLQIMRAGIMYMSGDSFTEKKEARSLIALSLGGLLLLLSPYIVFSIINPKILNLSLNFDSLHTNPPNFQPALTSGPWESTATDAAATCTSQGGIVSHPNPETTRCTPKAKDCKPFSVGITDLSAADIATETNNESCCSAQARCTLQKSPRGQSSCNCVASSTTP